MSLRQLAINKINQCITDSCQSVRPINQGRLFICPFLVRAHLRHQQHPKIDARCINWTKNRKGFLVTGRDKINPYQLIPLPMSDMSAFSTNQEPGGSWPVSTRTHARTRAPIKNINISFFTPDVRTFERSVSSHSPAYSVSFRKRSCFLSSFLQAHRHRFHFFILLHSCL